MITHSIITYKENKEISRKKTNNRFHGELESEEHKLYIFNRVLDNCPWDEGDHVQYNGHLAVVCDVAEEIDDCEWRGLECLCVEIWIYDTNESKLVHPNKLRNR